MNIWTPDRGAHIWVKFSWEEVATVWRLFGPEGDQSHITTFFEFTVDHGRLIRVVPPVHLPAPVVEHLQSAALRTLQYLEVVDSPDRIVLPSNEPSAGFTPPSQSANPDYAYFHAPISDPAEVRTPESEELIRLRRLKRKYEKSIRKSRARQEEVMSMRKALSREEAEFARDRSLMMVDLKHYFDKFGELAVYLAVSHALLVAIAVVSFIAWMNS